MIDTNVADSLQQGRWSESALRVLRERYLRKDSDGNVIETPEEMVYRVARNIAEAEANYVQDSNEAEETVEFWTKRFYDLMINRDFLPNSPTLMNSGTNNGLACSACFVLAINDSLDGEEGIYDTLKNAAVIHQSGGGTGFAFSRIREEGSPVSRSGGIASGPVSFLRAYDASTGAIKQGGRRRGANMAILNVSHPDILQFIECKNDGGITNFNISVGITNKFMEAVKNDEQHELISPHTGRVVRTIPARDVMDKIISSAWKTGDPGLVFLDRGNESRANPNREVIEATNPCSEQFLPPNEVCNLGSINLANFVEGGKVNYGRLQDVIWDSVRFLDGVIDQNVYVLDAIKQNAKNNRRIGLGIMGWADFLFKLGIPYDSDEALSLAEKIMDIVTEIGHQSSEALAKTRGPFPNWANSIYANGKPIRNSTVTTIAPTGSISILANCSSGIEPVFALAYQHRVKQSDGERVLEIVNPVLKEYIENNNYPKTTLDAIIKSGSTHGISELSEDVKRVFVTAHEVSPEWHVKVQAAFQGHTDNGVSKTINLPNSATEEDVRNAYLLAWNTGCLGITVFRDGCKGAQVLNAGIKTDLPQEEDKEPQELLTSARPVTVKGETTRINTPAGTTYVTMNVDEKNQPFEVFVTAGKAGSEVLAVSEGMARLMSLFLRTTSPMSQEDKVRHIIHQLEGIGGSQSIGLGPNKVMSLPDGIAKGLARLSEESVVIQEDNTEKRRSVDFCPSCNNTTLVHEEGCKKCFSCGFSAC